MTAESPAARLGRAVVHALVRAGVRDIVLAPGSRSAPLAFAAYDAAQAGLLRLHTRLDERTAGFLALGLTKVGTRAAVVCTSGTAVAHLHAAVLEAAHAGLPLVAVTADRPARLRGTGANQTTDQVRIFGPMAGFADLDHGSLAGPAGEETVGDGPVVPPDAEGPWHLNVRLEPPLVPEGRWSVPSVSSGPKRRPGEPQRRRSGPNGGPPGGLRHTLPRGPRTVVVAGDDAGPPPRILAERAGWPLLAEPTAGCRTGDHAIRTYRLLLGTDLGRQVERVVVAGHPTLSRPVADLLDRPDVEVVSMRARGVWASRPFPVSGEYDALDVGDPSDVDGGDDPGWLARWRRADADLSDRLDRLLAAEGALTPHEVAGAASRAVPPGGLLTVGASSAIRDLDLMAARYRVGERRKIIANRGLSGIDGTVSTAVGAALGRPHSTRALALLGDVTFLHDVSGLLLGPEEPRPDLTLVVVNDDGGSVFATLEQGAAPYADRYERLFGTPHGVELARLCAATGTPHRRVRSLTELDRALASPAGGVEVVEARVRRDNRRDLETRIRALARG